MPVAADPQLRGWYARLLGNEGPGVPGPGTLALVHSAAFPPGTVVDLPTSRLPPGWLVAVGSGDAGRISSVQVALPAAPHLWYVELPEPASSAPATTLVAFSDSRFSDGRFLHESEAGPAGVTGTAQVAAVRWWTTTGLVHQIYVGPQHRRRGVAGKLTHAAFAVQAFRGLAPLHGDGRRTDLGEAFAGGLPEYATGRLAPRTHRLPSMDPEG